MQEEIISLYKELIKKQLHEKCNERQQHLFKQMYSHNNLTKPIDDVVDDMSDNELDWALQQLKNTKPTVK